MSNRGRHRSHGGLTGRPGELATRCLQRLFGLFQLGDISTNGIEPGLVGDCSPGDPGVRAILVAKPVLKTRYSLARHQTSDLTSSSPSALRMNKPVKIVPEQLGTRPSQYNGPCGIHAQICAVNIGDD